MERPSRRRSLACGQRQWPDGAGVHRTFATGVGTPGRPAADPGCRRGTGSFTGYRLAGVRHAQGARPAR